jgi:hypothetical protein
VITLRLARGDIPASSRRSSDLALRRLTTNEGTQVLDERDPSRIVCRGSRARRAPSRPRVDNRARQRDAVGHLLGLAPRFQKRAARLRAGSWNCCPCRKWASGPPRRLIQSSPRLGLHRSMRKTWTSTYEVALVEVKATRKAIKNTALNGFFFGTTDRQCQLARAAGNRYWYAFIVLNSANDYGRPLYGLMPLLEMERPTQSKRLQYQVSFRTDGVPQRSTRLRSRKRC